ncbi:phosphotransferase [Mycoplasmopsis caviae]|uniref:CTP:phosphocholine cytidylyltransferase involved in choline phosphorylation for cell surface LPS epitopes n=1 Tax=Mycoplasmopsis caviae TaxID=55603 RepID=A0A3P8LI81_9BACT|nr:phosphotransferase [Mycoplasmopsis caviae]UUD35092.1 phosphotransferase [Mycoplasmopsis caviae]VDR42092.1 CTP:phosphocholine cytidylyltransferase involved in choline phosphorylation for cell surface LPS epitopes [Mycoplasmopsis caviae]
MNKNTQVIILAAGFGSRLTPLTLRLPKGLLEIKKDIRILPHLLNYLKDFKNKTIVTGYNYKLWDKLIKQENLNKVFNNEYSETNSLYSLYLAIKDLDNVEGGVLIVTNDTLFLENIFDKETDYSWVNTLSSDVNKAEWEIIEIGNRIVDFRIRDLNKVYKKSEFEFITGASFIHQRDFNKFKQAVIKRVENPASKQNDYWEFALLDILADIDLRKYNCDQKLYEIDDFSDLLSFDNEAPCFKNDIYLNKIKEIFNVEFEDILNIEPVKKGMTNDSFSFNIKDKKYIARIPKEGSKSLINRYQEKDVYKKLENNKISEKVVYFETNEDIEHPLHGFKITEWINNAKSINGNNSKEVKNAIETYRNFHNQKLSVNFDFDILKLLDYYISIIGEEYKNLPKHIIDNEIKIRKMLEYHKLQNFPKVLCHIDSTAGNILIDKQGKIKLIDWEYAANSDPFLDIANLCMDCQYGLKEANWVLETYLQRKPTKEEKNRLYILIASVGLLWTYWCEYKKIYNEFYNDYYKIYYSATLKFVNKVKYE